MLNNFIPTQVSEAEITPADAPLAEVAPVKATLSLLALVKCGQRQPRKH